MRQHTVNIFPRFQKLFKNPENAKIAYLPNILASLVVEHFGHDQRRRAIFLLISYSRLCVRRSPS